ncbi:MAG: GAF domain-containing protein [Elusimicrobia bacterium]|nr:GAF domain-containing protein [Elusimicrobiota bacterium]
MDIDNLLVTLASIHEFGIKTNEILSKEEFSQSVVDAACSIIHSDLSSLMLTNENDELYIIASKGLSKKLREETKLKIGEGVAGRVVASGEYIFVENIETDARFLKSSHVEKYISKSFISIPLKVKNKVIGVLNINSSKNKKYFDDRDLKLITILADQAAMRLENIDMFNNLQAFYLEMIQALVGAIDAKDSYTHGHSTRAKKYAGEIATKISMPQTIKKNIEYAAIMHDIGKIGVPDSVLLKKDKLTSEEVKVIRQHPSIGYNIISPIRFLSAIAPMILYHHEWYNGAGYPEGLAKEEIPLGARIIAVIDAYDAMTSDRPYRKALSVKDAVEQLKQGAGKQFDPKIVDIFVKILKEEKILN